MQESDYRNLIHHMEWSDARIWTCILNSTSSRHDEWIKERLHHYHSTQWAYGQILLKMPIVIPELGNFPDIKSVGLWAQRFYKELCPKVIGFSRTEFQHKVEFPWSAQGIDGLGNAVPANAGESLIQLALHSAHHRGQAAMRVRETGGKPPATDFIVWIWMGRPAAQWGVLSKS
jgi:hypothetical protein